MNLAHGELQLWTHQDSDWPELSKVSGGNLVVMKGAKEMLVDGGLKLYAQKA